MAGSGRNGDGIKVGSVSRGLAVHIAAHTADKATPVQSPEPVKPNGSAAGTPHVNPLLAARATRRPTPSTSPSPENTGASGKDRAQASASKDAAATGSDESPSLWTIAAVTATAAVIIGAVVAVRMRSRRA